jgi:hypothetical protein
MTNSPIACTLNPSEMRERAASVDRLLRDAMLGQTTIEGGIRTRFRDEPDVERRVRELVDAESRCCAFLAFAVGRDSESLWLEITGTAEARPVIEELCSTTASTPGWRRSSPRSLSAPGAEA